MPLRERRLATSFHACVRESRYESGQVLAVRAPDPHRFKRGNLFHRQNLSQRLLSAASYGEPEAPLADRYLVATAEAAPVRYLPSMSAPITASGSPSSRLKRTKTNRVPLFVLM